MKFNKKMMWAGVAWGAVCGAVAVYHLSTSKYACGIGALGCGYIVVFIAGIWSELKEKR